MGEAQIGLSDQASERDTVVAATKTGCLDVIKNSQRDHPGRPPNKTDPFHSTRIFHTLNINKAIVTASFIICVQREREKERVMNLKINKIKEKETDTNTNANTATGREREMLFIIIIIVVVVVLILISGFRV